MVLLSIQYTRRFQHKLIQFSIQFVISRTRYEKEIVFVSLPGSSTSHEVCKVTLVAKYNGLQRSVLLNLYKYFNLTAA